MADVTKVIGNAVTTIGYKFAVSHFVKDLNGNIIKIKGTISIPQNGSIAAQDKDVYWNTTGKCLNNGSNSDFDLVILQPVTGS